VEQETQLFKVSSNDAKWGIKGFDRITTEKNLPFLPEHLVYIIKEVGGE
jgi:hypothetical protein